MDHIRVKAKTAVPYAEDGITVTTLVAGQVVNAPAHIVAGLLAEGLAEETDEEVTPPERLAELRAAHADPHAEAGVTPWQGVRAGKQEPTAVEDEHLEPVRRVARERAAGGRGVAETAQPATPPPPPPPGSVVDADGWAARDAAEAEALAELRAGKGGDAKGGPGYATKDERPGRKRGRAG